MRACKPRLTAARRGGLSNRLGRRYVRFPCATARIFFGAREPLRRGDSAGPGADDSCGGTPRAPALRSGYPRQDHDRTRKFRGRVGIREALRRSIHISVLHCRQGPDGTIIFVVGRGIGHFWRVSQAGSVATAITSVNGENGELYHALPNFLPDGRHFLYLRGPGQSGGIYVGSLDAKPAEQSRQRLLATSVEASYADGYLFFMRENTLMAQPFRYKQISAERPAHADRVARDLYKRHCRRFFRFSESSPGLPRGRCGPKRPTDLVRPAGHESGYSRAARFVPGTCAFS